MTSRKVCALGALLFSSMANVAKRMIWTVAPDAYLVHNQLTGYDDGILEQGTNPKRPRNTITIGDPR